MTRTVIVTAISAAVYVGAFPQAQVPVQAGFRVTNVRIFDGEHVIPDSGAAVEGGIIRGIGRDLSRWQHLPAIDGMGATLLPGLIDAHVHVRAADELRQALRFGVTTALDLGAIVEPETLFALRTMARAASDMAELRIAGFAAIAGGPQEPPARLLVASTPRLQTIADARRFVETRRIEGADHLKIILRGMASANSGALNFDVPQIRALVESAHAADLVATAHVETLDDVQLALAGGVDVLVHVWRMGGANLEVARQIAARGTFVMPIAVGPDSFLPASRAGLLADERFGPLLSSEIRDHLRPDRSFPLIPITSAPVEQRRASFDVQLAAIRSLRQAGVRFIAGSDASSISPVAFGISFHRELELLVDIGLTPSDVLAAATSTTARAFRLEDRGRIAPGLRADLLLVRGDPTSDIRATRDIQRVWKAGREIQVSRANLGRGILIPEAVADVR